MLPWIKHHCDANTNIQLSNLIEKHGVEAYGRYWLFLEYLCQIYKRGSPPEFTLTRSDMYRALRLYPNSTLRVLVEYLTSTRGVLIEYIDGTYKVKAPILLELLDSDFKRARQRRDSDTPKILDKEKEKEIYKEKVSPKIKPKADASRLRQFDLFYSRYPKKEGRAKAEERFVKDVVDDKTLNLLLQAQKNYLAKLKAENTEYKFTMKASTFMNNWRDYLDYIPVKRQNDKETDSL